MEFNCGHFKFGELLYANNGIGFPVKQLPISPSCDYYPNRACKERHILASSYLDNFDSIAKGVHYLLKDDSGRVWLIKRRGV